MKLAVSSIIGLPSLPSTGAGIRKWLKARNIPTEQQGKRFVFNLIDLPKSTRRAYNERRIANANLPMGIYDEDAHADFLNVPTSMRREAERKAGIAEALLKVPTTANWAERVSIVREKFGDKGTSKPSLERILNAVKHIDPINYAPALVAKHKGRTAKAETSDAAWSFFMTTIRDAGAEFPLKQAWRDVHDLKNKMGWQWPSYPTINRRWAALSDAQKSVARLGRKATGKQFAQPAFRDKTTISPLEIVSLDGRTQDFWVANTDGKPRRMTMLALVDVASNMVLDYELADSENARDTLRLIQRACQTYGIFDKIYTDNGASFAGHLVAGGNVHKFLNGGKHLEGVKPLGICFHLGIKLQFALPGNGQAKIAERTFATLSRVIDDRPEFKGAHAGHAPGASPDQNVVPVDRTTAERIIRREVDRHNNEAGRRSQGARGRSYAGVFHDGMAQRIMRKPTKRQLYLAGLIYTPVAVDRFGQVRVENWTYGGPDTQADILPYHSKGQRILLGRDPDDFAAPALAFNEDNRLICEGIEAVIAGAYDSVEGVRTAARNRKAARNAAAVAETANDYMDRDEFERILAQLSAPEMPLVTRPTKVVGARFGSPLRDANPDPDKMDSVPAEFLRNMNALLAEKRAKGEKLA